MVKMLSFKCLVNTGNSEEAEISVEQQSDITAVWIWTTDDVNEFLTLKACLGFISTFPVRCRLLWPSRG